MIPKEIELQILQDLESINRTKTVAIFHDKGSEWGYLNSDIATSYAINSKIAKKEIKGLNHFKITDLKELFKGSIISVVTFCDYSNSKAVDKC